MNFTLRIRMRKAEGALARLLGQIGRRSYDVLALTARATSDGAAYDVEVEFAPIPSEAVPAGRPPDVLVRMVEKLCDVERAELVAPARPAGPPPDGAPRPERRADAARPAGEMSWEE